MTAGWTTEELARIGAAEELQMAPLGVDRAPRRHAPYFDGIVRIGELDGDMGPIGRLPEGASVTIERAG